MFYFIVVNEELIEVAANEESVRSQNADLKRSEKQPILIADELHWRKLWGVTQKKLKSVE